MAEHVVPHFHNDPGVPVIEIGAKEFMCVGATPPYDHPHVFLDMGDDNEIICPYCSTLYRFDRHARFARGTAAGMRLAADRGGLINIWSSEPWRPRVMSSSPAPALRG